MPGFVIFPDVRTFNENHDISKTFNNIPISARRKNRIDISKQRAEQVVDVFPKLRGVLDGSVVAYIKERFWPPELLVEFVLLRENQLADYKPSEKA